MTKIGRVGFVFVLTFLGVAGLFGVMAQAQALAGVEAGKSAFLAAAVTGGGAACEGNNLLTNPGFEGEYTPYIYPAPGNPDCQTWDPAMPNQYCERAKMPDGWHPRWLPDGTKEWLVMPEFVPSTPDQVNPDRVRSGQESLHYFSFFTMHEAAVHQQVTAVPGATYCFSAWGHAWSDRTDDDFYSATDPFNDGDLYQKVGIDPTGGTDWQSPTVIWSDERKQYDIFGEFTISATAQANTITVFVYSRADKPVKHNDVYWDDASLQAAPYMLVDNSTIGMMAHVLTPTQMTLSVPVTIHPDTLAWTASFAPGGSITPTFITNNGTGSGQASFILDSTGLGTGTYTTTLQLATSSTATGSPASVPVAVYVVDNLFQVYLPAAMR